jgi:nucleoside-diphosphate-sugar epimerase
MHALVTGGGGFLGRYIVEQLLARGDRVRSFGRGDYPELAAMGVEVVRGDIGDYDDIFKACQGIDCVFHTAAVAGLSVHWSTFFTTNLWGTGHLVVSCERQGVPRLVYTSSPSVVFAGRDQEGVNESEPIDDEWLYRHRAHYSRTKWKAEESVLGTPESRGMIKAGGTTLRPRFEEVTLEPTRPSIATCALRPHLIWGPRDTHLIPRLLQRAHSGRLRRVGDGANLVDITYVENAAQAHLLAADALAMPDSPAAGKAYFISQGEPVNCWQWIDEILALAGLPPVRKSISFNAAWRFGAVCETVYRVMGLSGEPPMTRFLAAQLARSHWFDISAARRDLGYSPRVSTEEGMRQLGVWLRNPDRASN